jgi:hypothetical protein
MAKLSYLLNYIVKLSYDMTLSSDKFDIGDNSAPYLKM